MTLQNWLDSIPNFGRDIKLNLDTLLKGEGALGLTRQQVAAIALSCSYVVNVQKFTEAILDEFKAELPESTVEAAKSASTIMAMNNVYYRFLSMVDDSEFKKMPAKLRMNILLKPGVEKSIFELMSLAVSALNGCSSCIKAHTEELIKLGLSREGIQSSIRIAAVIRAAGQLSTISSLG